MTHDSAKGRALAVIGCGAACLALLAGCRSTTRTDLVEREMRQQEDQIYAMQDYLADYEQLLCQYRSENAELKRQLVTGQYRDGTRGPRSDSMKAKSRSTAPSLPEDELPDGESDPMPFGVPPLDFDETDIPPLERSSSNESEPDECPSDADNAYEETSVQLVAYAPERPSADDDLPNVAARTLSDSDVSASLEAPAEGTERQASRQVTQVVLRGQVWPGNGAAGPRVLVDVDPLTTDGTPALHDGPLSLMALDVDSNGAERSLARWDFTAEELRSLAVEGTNGTAFQFPLQLPATTPVEEPVEFWCRLMPLDGEKILAHAAVDLGRAGEFASEMPIWQAEAGPIVVESVKVEKSPVQQSGHISIAELDSTDTPDVPVRQSDWHIARPDDPPKSPAESGIIKSEWRLATQPVPPAQERPIYDTMPRDSRSSDLDRRNRREPARRPEKLRTPQWSPDRPTVVIESSSNESAHGQPPLDHIVPPPRPAWSPSR
jgi:hypothetical protein